MVSNPVTDDLREMAVDVLQRFDLILKGADPLDVGCVLPQDYLWFTGDGRMNHHRNAYIGGTEWDWSWPNPYEAAA